MDKIRDFFPKLGHFFRFSTPPPPTPPQIARLSLGPRMELFCENYKLLLAVNYFRKGSIIDVQQGPKFDSGSVFTFDIGQFRTSILA